MEATRTQIAVSSEQDETHFARFQARNSRPALEFGGLWANRKLLNFFLCRYTKARYKQIGKMSARVILQPELTMDYFSLFFGKLSKHLPRDCPSMFFITGHFSRRFISEPRCKVVLTPLAATRGLWLEFVFGTSYCLMPLSSLAFGFLNVNFREIGQLANGSGPKYERRRLLQYDE
jgi:hypothetical protein